MKKLMSYLLLPEEISQFERQYLARINRIALIFFVFHVPAFVCVALVAGTSAIQAAILTPMVLVGPLVAYRFLRNPRHLSIVSGFTAMCMGGLLVHFGRGSMQIEMHFYFFVLIALLAVFANPLAIITAAVTVALHHLVLYLVLPSSVFNYDASIWAVVVHAGFVVLESIAACFVARSFFDNVIGLEKIVKRRTNELSDRNQDMRLVLDNVGQGFLTINLDGTLSPERSAVADDWLGSYVPGKKIWECLADRGPFDTSWFQLGWDSVAEDVMPVDISLGQLPKRWNAGPRTFSLEYRPVSTAGKLAKVLLVMSDVTAEVERERIESEQRDFLRVFAQVMKDKKGFLGFFAEADDIVLRITRGGLPAVEMRRMVHTLKGNAAVFGLSRLSTFCHDLESRMVDDGAPTDADTSQLKELWGGFASKLHALLGNDGARRVEVDHKEYVAVLQALDGSLTRREIAQRMKGWEFDTADMCLNRVAEQARALARRLGKGPVDVVIESNGLRLASEKWAEFWSAFTHPIRNALDHGIEPAAERVTAGKPEGGQIRLATRLEQGDLVIEISDDGRGISWEILRERATAAGLAHASREDLVEAMFRDGITTKREVSEISGRGIGMGVIRSVCQRMGGSVRVLTTEGRGTSLQFRWDNVIQRVDPLVFGPVPTNGITTAAAAPAGELPQ